MQGYGSGKTDTGSKAVVEKNLIVRHGEMPIFISTPQVFSHNSRAIRMYEGLGFFREGLRPRQAKAKSLSGRQETIYFDELLMGLFVGGEVFKK